MAARLNAVPTERTDLSPDSFILRVAPLGWELPPFRAGQYAVLGLPPSAPRVESADPEEPRFEENLIRRAYSIASSPVGREALEFYIRLVNSGVLTPRLAALKPGDRLWMSRQIRGMFTLDRLPPGVNLVMIATGTGLAAYMSTLRTRLASHGGEVAVLHGAHHSWHLGYMDELMALQRRFENLVYLPVLDSPEEELTGWAGAIGQVQDLWAELPQYWGFRPTPDHTHVLLCGNPVMIEDMTGTLEAEGFRPDSKRRMGQIHAERYW